ncbi:hypothetical protein [Pseudomonas sp. TMB3-21]
MIKDDVSIVAGNFVSIGAGFSTQWDEDVVNSLLFAELYANSEADRFQNPQQWSIENSKAMRQLKWDLSSSTTYSYTPDAILGFVLEEAVMQKLNAALGAAHNIQMGRLIDALQKPSVAEGLMAETGEHAVFRVSTVSTQQVATFCLRYSLVEPGPAVSNVLVFFKTTEDVDAGFMGHRFESETILGEVTVQVTRRVLDKKYYERKGLRSLVKEMLPSERDHLICNLDSRYSIASN